MKTPSVFLILCALGVAASAAAQNPRTNASDLVFRDHIVPHWFAGAGGMTNKFWYSVNAGPGENEFILVDAARGKRSPAFDPARVAEALSKVTGHAADPKNLRIYDLQFAPDTKSVILRMARSSWKLDLDSYALTAATDDSDERRVPAGRAPHPSHETGPASQLTLLNRLDADVNFYWIDFDGKRAQKNTIHSGDWEEIQTYRGHVFVVTSLGGDVLAVFEALAEPAVGVIDGHNSDIPDTHQDSTHSDDSDGKSPDGRWQALVRGENLFLRDLKADKNREHQLTFDANPNSTYARNAETDRAIEMNYDAADPVKPTPEVYWAQDSKHFVAIRLQPAAHRRVYLIESSPEDQLQPKLDSYPYLKPGDQVPIRKPRLFDVEGAKEIPVSDALFSNPWSISDVRWSSNSTQFTFLYNQRGHQVLRVVAVDARTGEAKAILDEHSDTFIDYSGKMFVNYLDDAGEILWASERDGWNHLYLYDAIAGRVKNQVTRGDWVVRDVDYVDIPERQIWFQAGGIHSEQDPYYTQLCRVNFDGTGMTVLSEGDGTHQTKFSPDRGYFLDSWSRVDLPPVTELRGASDGKLVCKLEEAGAAKFFAAGFKTPERFVAKGRDGATDIYGVIWRPKEFDAQKKYPVIENIYAGPQRFYTPKSFHAQYGQQELADHGFIVVQMDGMGTSGRSKKFHDVCWKNIRDAGLPDRILWTKAAAATRPFMDLSRVGVYGGSAGGQNALRAMLDHGDFYKVCVSDSGCHDNRMDKIWWNEQWMGWPVDESYARSSNVEDAQKLQGKLLLMVGEMDRNVDPSSTMQVVNALIKADKDFELLVMPGAGHGVAGTPYGARRLNEFFARNLLAPERKILAGAVAAPDSN